jgi:hypothetical protein
VLAQLDVTPPGITALASRHIDCDRGVRARKRDSWSRMRSSIVVMLVAPWIAPQNVKRPERITYGD